MKRVATVAIKIAVVATLLAASLEVRSKVVPHGLQLNFQPYAGDLGS